MLACLQFNDITKEKENHTCIVMQCEWKKIMHDRIIHGFVRTTNEPRHEKTVF